MIVYHIVGALATIALLYFFVYHDAPLLFVIFSVLTVLYSALACSCAFPKPSEETSKRHKQLGATMSASMLRLIVVVVFFASLGVDDRLRRVIGVMTIVCIVLMIVSPKLDVHTLLNYVILVVAFVAILIFCKNKKVLTK